MFNHETMDYNDQYDNFLNINSLTSDKINSINVDSRIADGSISRSKISNLSVDTLDVSISGYIKSGKTSFTDNVNPGWWLSNEGFHIGNAWNTSKFKFNVSTWAIELAWVTIEWTDVTWATKPADNATVGATFWVNIWGGWTGTDQINNNWYITKISGNTITTGTLNANLCNITNINASNIVTWTLTGITITGNTIKTDSWTYPKTLINSLWVTVHWASLFFKNSLGDSTWWIGEDGDWNLHITAFSMATNPSLFLYWENDVEITSWAEYIRMKGDAVPYTNNSFYLWNSSNYWSRWYINRIYASDDILLTPGSWYWVMPSSNGFFDLWQLNYWWRWIFWTAIYVWSWTTTSTYWQISFSSSMININKSLFVWWALKLDYSSTNPSSVWEIRNYSSWWINQFRWRPGSWVWVGSFDMTAY